MANIRNDILVRIVVAEGGTVRDPNNQAGLLQDILIARGESPTSRIRNVLLSEILASYSFTGIADAVAGAIFGIADQPLLSSYQTGLAVNLRSNTTGDVSFLNGKINGTTWDTLTVNGANDAFATKWYDQIGSNDASQGTGSQQPIVDRNGVSTYDNINDLLVTPSMAGPTTQLSGIISVNFTDFTDFQIFFSQDGGVGGVNRAWQIVYSSGADQLRIVLYMSGVPSTISIANASSVIGTGVKRLIGWSYDSVNGGGIYLDGVPQTVSGGGLTGSIDSVNTPLRIGSWQNGTLTLDGSMSTNMVWFSELSDADHLLVYNTWSTNNA